MIGTLNSPCAVAALPELARAPGGPLAMVSPAASYAGLTRRTPGAPPGELRSLYPTGRRHFARVFPADDHQAVALAALARDLGAVRVAALDDGDLAYGSALADRFARAARALGAHGRRPPALGARRRRATGGSRPPSPAHGPTPSSSAASSTRTGRPSSGRCGALCRRTTAILLGDGFTPTRFLVRQAGAAAEGAYVGVTGLVDASLGARGRAFVAAFGATLPGVEIEPTAVYTAEATGVLLDAVARSDGIARRRARRALPHPLEPTG